MSKLASGTLADYFFIAHIKLWQILLVVIVIIGIVYIIKRSRVV